MLDPSLHYTISNGFGFGQRNRWTCVQGTDELVFTFFFRREYYPEILRLSKSNFYNNNRIDCVLETIFGNRTDSTDFKNE